MQAEGDRSQADRDGAENVRRFVTASGSRLYARQDEITEGMTAVLAGEIEFIGADRPLIEQLERSIRGNVTTVFNAMANEAMIERLEPPIGALDYARLLAQRAIPASHLVRAYSIGQNYLLEAAFDEVQRGNCPKDIEHEVLRTINKFLFHYIDWVSLIVGKAHADEQARWSQAKTSSALPLIRALLDGRTVESREFERETGYRLTETHLAMVLWVHQADNGTPDPEKMRRFVHTIETACGAIGRPLLQMIDSATMWIWMPVASDATGRSMTQLGARLEQAGPYRIAVGAPGRGQTGFARSHRQAIATRDVAVTASRSAQRTVTCYRDRGVRAVSLVVKDIDVTTAWIDEVLGELATDDETTALLRETWRVFFHTGENYLRTAELLNVHRNTVKYRLGKISPHIGDSADDDRTDIVLALEICHLLGARVLRPEPRTRTSTHRHSGEI